MPNPDPAALAFLLARRSHPARTLRPPAPDRAALEPILTAAARSPDHGKLEPWRFIVLGRPALERLAALARDRGKALGLDEAATAKAVSAYADSPLAVAVVASPRHSDKVPGIEQTLSAGAVCLGLLNAALASGWGAAWLTGWAAQDRPFLEEGLGLAAHEFLAGMIHIGTGTATPADRPRPEIEAITLWMDV